MDKPPLTAKAPEQASRRALSSSTRTPDSKPQSDRLLGTHADDYLLDDVDLVLLDIKAFKEATYRRLTGVPLRPTLEFAERLAAMGKPIRLRYVLAPGLTDDLTEIEGLAEFAAGLGVVERVDVLPFHKMGEFKWRELGLHYRLTDTQPPSTELTERVRDRFRAHGLWTA